MNPKSRFGGLSLEVVVSSEGSERKIILITTKRFIIKINSHFLFYNDEKKVVVSVRGRINYKFAVNFESLVSHSRS